jgi:3-oxosteroid 1-dehydrogenase
MAEWDYAVDFLIVGSGGGGLVAALAAADAGMQAIVLEKQQYVGGSTAMSGGVIWMPDNPLMRADGIPDSFQAGMDYLESVIGAPDQPSSLARRRAFLRTGPEMISFIQDKGVKLTRCDGYSDYYDNRNGGNAAGRSVEGVPWDGRQLGDWHAKINPGMARGLGMAVMTNEVRNLPVYTRSPRSFAVTAKVVLRTLLSRLAGQDLLTNGMSLMGQLTKIALAAGVPIWLGTAVQELVLEDGRVAGVRAVRNGVPVTIRGNKGVLLAAGGFERNSAMRSKYTAESQPNDGRWTVANPGNTGEVLEAAIAIGAKTDYMDDAVWNPFPRPELMAAGSTLSIARQYARTIYVNSHGQRFVNEANSYVELGKAMYAGDAVPAWLIFDDEFRRRRPWGSGLPKLRDIAAIVPGRLPEEWTANGWIRKSDTIEGLATMIGIDPQALAATVRQFNAGAVSGRDPQFGRGESQYNKVLGDPGNKPNPSVGPIDKGPFYATEIYPGDVGTTGGVITNEHAQVLDPEDRPIPGLYATGNMSATVVGRTYPGAGASIANTTVFGYIAAQHAGAQSA